MIDIDQPGVGGAPIPASFGRGCGLRSSIPERPPKDDERPLGALDEPLFRGRELFVGQEPLLVKLG